jgi:hypothetical protein
MTGPGAAPSGGTGRVWLRRAGRTATGAMVLGLVAVVVLIGQRLPVADARAVPDPQVSVPPSATTLVCPGSVQLPGVTGSTDSQFDPVPVAPVSRVDAVTIAPDAGAAAVRGLDGAAPVEVPAGGGSVGAAGLGPAVVVRAEAGRSAPTAVAAASTTVVSAGDLRGLSGASCQAATASSWLVGGATSTGATTRLVLVNPGSTPAQVTWQVWGSTGPVDLTSTQQLVAPGGQAVVNLDAVAADQRAVVVHVAATGALVWAHLQDDRLDGFTPAGSDLVVAGTAPALRQVVPGLLVDAAAVGDPAQGVLRLLAPGRDTTARITVLGGDGPVDVPGADTVALVAGQVADVPLGGLPAGRYTVVVDADQPVLAGASFGRVGSAGELDTVPRVDRASAAATPGGAGLIAVPDQVDATLVVGAVASGDDPAADVTGHGTVSLIGSSGAVLSTHDLAVDAGTTGQWTLTELLDGVKRSAVAGLRVESTDAKTATLSWALVVERVQADGTLVSVLDPTAEPEVQERTAVRADPALGIG